MAFQVVIVDHNFLQLLGIEITASTVTFQNWRVASDDPVKSIKAE